MESGRILASNAPIFNLLNYEKFKQNSNFRHQQYFVISVAPLSMKSTEHDLIRDIYQSRHNIYTGPIHIQQSAVVSEVSGAARIYPVSQRSQVSQAFQVSHMSQVSKRSQMSQRYQVSPMSQRSQVSHMSQVSGVSHVSDV